MLIFFLASSLSQHSRVSRQNPVLRLTGPHAYPIFDILLVHLPLRSNSRDRKENISPNMNRIHNRHVYAQTYAVPTYHDDLKLIKYIVMFNLTQSFISFAASIG